MKWYVHVNQHKIRKNIHAEVPEPPIAIKQGKSGVPSYCHGVDLPSGSKLVYSHSKPLLGCGARLVIECPTEPTITS